jgi:hypothetical protein
MATLDKTDALWEELKCGLLANGWVKEREDKLVKHYQTSIGPYYDKLLFCTTQCMGPSQYGNGRELFLRTQCNGKSCDSWADDIWKINADDGFFKRWQDNGQIFWLRWESADIATFRLDFAQRIAKADTDRTRIETH